jgi:vacuolar protein sorting-associated protein 1
VLQGRSHRLKHGYYCVRLPDDEERARQITRTEADRVASNFFAETPPWCEVLAEDPTRFGIPSFVSDISVLLTAIIEKASVE